MAYPGPETYPSLDTFPGVKPVTVLRKRVAGREPPRVHVGREPKTAVTGRRRSS